MFKLIKIKKDDNKKYKKISYKLKDWLIFILGIFFHIINICYNKYQEHQTSDINIFSIISTIFIIVGLVVIVKDKDDVKL
jgi:vacuolar-type H+-ATPase subunit I/STV1